MARLKTNLLNFSQPKKSARDTTGLDGAPTDAQQVTYFKNLFLRSIGGAFRNADDVNAYVNFLKGMDQTPEVIIETTKAENEALTMDHSQQSIFSDISRARDSLNDNLRLATDTAKGDLNELLRQQSFIYAQAAEEMDNLAADTLKNYASNTALPDDFYTFKKEVEDKANSLTSLSAQLNTPELVDSFDPETVSLQITTNPSTGVISDVKFVPRGQVDKGYVETDLKMKVRDGIGALPVSINAIDNGQTSGGTLKRMARLGDIKLFGSFSASAKKDTSLDSEYGLYTLQAEDNAGFSPFSTSLVEAGRNDGLTMQAFKVNGDEVGSGSVVRRGTRLFYVEDNGNLQEFDGSGYGEKVAKAKAYLTRIGDQNISKVDYPLPVSDLFLSKPTNDGSRASRIDYGPSVPLNFNPMSVPQAESMAPVASTDTAQSSGGFFTAKQPAATSAATPAPQTMADASFFNRKNRMNKPEEARPSSSPLSFANDIIDKGKQFFLG